MGKVSARIEVTGPISEAEALWYDPIRWPAFVEGFAHIIKREGKWPDKDARILRAIFIDERPKDEVCAEMRVDRDYLRVLLHRAKNQFRRLYLKKIDDQAPRAANE